MDWTTLRNKWEAFVPQILTRWPDLPEEDVLALAGDRDGLVTLLSDLAGIDEAEADQQIESWLGGEEPADAVMDPSRDNERIMASAAHIPPGEDVYDDDADFGDDAAPDRPIGRD